jgi:CBS domain-containing protein
MKARDVMTTAVVSVDPDTPLSAIAKTLVEHGISAVPVLDRSGAAVGMVSEGDLIGRDDAARQARRDWWLTMLAEGEALSPEFLATLRSTERRAHDVMTTPVITVGEDADLGEAARLLTEHRIKRVPVVASGDLRIIGIVSRADLVRAMASEHGEPKELAPRAAPRHGLLADAIATLDDHFRHRAAVEQMPGPAPAPLDQPKLTVTDFRGLVADYRREQHRQQEAAHRTEVEQRRRRIAELVNLHVSEEEWRTLLHRAREAAEHGTTEFMLQRFPSELCSDGGRAINAALPDWPATLRGEAAELYRRWDRDLKTQGFHLAARVLDFLGGKPGDIGLFLAWGE